MWEALLNMAGDEPEAILYPISVECTPKSHVTA